MGLATMRRMVTEFTGAARVAANVRFHMGVADVPQKAAAAATGLSVSAFSSRYKGESKFRIEELSALADLVRVPLDHLTSQDGPHGTISRVEAATDVAGLRRELNALLEEVRRTAELHAETASRLAAHVTAVEQLRLQLRDA